MKLPEDVTLKFTGYQLVGQYSTYRYGRNENDDTLFLQIKFIAVPRGEDVRLTIEEDELDEFFEAIAKMSTVRKWVSDETSKGTETLISGKDR